MGEQKRCKTTWMLTTPVSGGSMEASAHQELMDSPREAQLKLHTDLFFAESELIGLKPQKSQEESNFTRVSHCCSEQSQHRMCFSTPLEHYSSFMVRMEHPRALQAASAPITQGLHTCSGAASPPAASIPEHLLLPPNHISRR